MSTHECPGGDCAATVDSGRLACRRCWFKLPKHLRDAVWTAYRNRVAAPGEHRRAVTAALDWYRVNT